MTTGAATHTELRALSLVALAATVALLAGCGGDDESGDAANAASSFETYVDAVEPIRLGTNRLLDRADPIMSAYREGEIGAGTAERRMDALERRLAEYAVQIAAVRSVPDAIRPEHRAYAHTWILEDSYVSALVAAIPEREFEELPDTQARQRAAIIAWRTRLEVLADRLGVRLPRDIQIAGRGEIAPSPIGE